MTVGQVTEPAPERAEPTTGPRSRLLVVVAAVAILMAGCGGDSDPAAQPAPEPTGFTQGQFEDIPLVPRSRPVQERTVVGDGTITATYLVDDIATEDVAAFYDEELPPLGWRLLDTAAAPSDDGFYRSDWTNGDRRLEISANQAPAADGDAGTGDSTDRTIQYSLVLSPDLAENPPTTPTP